MSLVSSIVCWHPVLTEHQSHTLRALAEATNAKVTVMVARREDPTRKAQGWIAPDTGGLEVRVLEAGDGLTTIHRMLREHRDSVHLFGSPFDHPRFMAALAIAAWRRLAVHLISEPYSPVADGYLDDRHRLMTRLKSKLRPWVYKVYGALLGGRVRGVFAISPLAAAQYQAIGIPAAKIHPFGYFVPALRTAAPPKPATHEHADGVRALFVGNLIARKGLAELCAAVQDLRAQGLDLRLDVYGTGDVSAFDFDGVAVRHAGSIPFGQAQSVIAAYDFLVLPSRYDGWGVVVNESVLAGVPVVCSDRVGAGGFVRRWGCGLVYSTQTPGALGDALLKMSRDAQLRSQMRQACREARHRLEPAVGGRYLADVIEACACGERAPANPWYDC